MTIVAAPDEVRDQVRNLTRMQLIRVVAAWRTDVSNVADPVSAYRVVSSRWRAAISNCPTRSPASTT